MAQEGSIDTEEHIGSFFWLVGRTSKGKEANMEMQTASFERSYKVTLPGPKRRKVSNVSWDPNEMPSLPIMVNKKALKKNTKLLVFQPEQKKSHHKIKDDK